VRIGTRGSALALAQAEPVAEALGGELVVITTSGDRDRAAGDKGRWVAEIERALVAEEIDLAVHSAKDVPAELAEGLVLLPPPPRADPRDAVCGAIGLHDVAERGRIGTSSLRREAQLRALRPDLEVVELRGNVDTRLRRLADGDFDAIVIAYAGLQRLGRADEGVPLDELVPAAGQGTLALEARDDDEPTRRRATKLTDGASNVAQQAERALVRALDADCHTPVGGHALPVGGGLRLRAFVGRPDGSAWLTDELEGPDPIRLGEDVAARLLSAGAAEVLGR
jgi:hydroxymethylbilane synthase